MKDDLNKRFAELVGIEPTYKIRIGLSSEEVSPDFVADPRLVLREMDKLVLMDEFVVRRYLHQHPIMFAHDILDNSGLLVEAAIDFMEERR